MSRLPKIFEHRANVTLRTDDVEECLRLLREGSKSFAAAGRLLPSRLVGPVAAIYAFCRTSDDAIDVGGNETSLRRLSESLDRVYARQPSNDVVERAFCSVVHEFAIPRAIPNALLEGYAWDLEGKRYETFSDLTDYCVRVASTVGLMMTLVMSERRPQVLARACELGVAMQLTNIARDVGEDARSGRIYLPLAWMRRSSVAPEEFVANPAASFEVRAMTRRLLSRAEKFYETAERGIAYLPADCRTAILAARKIYAEIGQVIQARGYDSVSTRAQTTRGKKLELLASALPARVYAQKKDISSPPLPETAFLIESVSRT